MKITDTSLPDVKIIEPQVFEDQRGYFFESYNKIKYQSLGIDIDFVQDNQSKSSYGVIRGLHFQMSPKAQSKLIRVLEGTIYDIAVDIRVGSPQYGQWFGMELSAENKKQLFIPKGFAHGFSVLSKTAIILYKCDEFYSPEHDSGIAYNDPALNIDWKIDNKDILISEKDKALPTLSEARNNFRYK